MHRGAVAEDVQARHFAQRQVGDDDVDPRRRGLRHLADGEGLRAEVDAAELGHHLGLAGAAEHQPGVAVQARQQVLTGAGLPLVFLAL